MAHILLAEDDDSLRRFLTRALERAGHSVVAVADGTEAVPLLSPNAFDLLLADIVMSGMDGIALAQRASWAMPTARVMLITGFAAVALKARNLLQPRTKIVSKPFHLRGLVDEVDKLLAA